MISAISVAAYEASSRVVSIIMELSKIAKPIIKLLQ